MTRAYVCMKILEYPPWDRYLHACLPTMSVVAHSVQCRTHRFESDRRRSCDIEQALLSPLLCAGSTQESART